MINIDRSQPAPSSLDTQKAYRSPDVWEALYRDFLGKCYLTEQVFESPAQMEIDHFVPKNEQPDLTYSWENLYPIEQKANKQRSGATPNGGYLDPCHKNDDVEQAIHYIVSFNGDVLFRAKDAANLKAVNTALLLGRLHKELKKSIQDKHHELVHTIARWRTARDEKDTLEELKQELILRSLLSRRGPYTMLMRAVDVVQYLPPQFFD